MNRQFNQTNLLAFLILLLLQSIQVLQAGTYKEVTNFGENPGNTRMFLYTPDKVAEKPPILVVCHWCHGTANDCYNASYWYCSYADKSGYYVIFPNAPSSDGCWDVASVEALTHNGGGDPLGIASMVRHVIKNYNADSARVYVTGVSSGAMMTNVLLGAYPDLFAAGSAFAGVPFGCFSGPNSWNDDCAKGRITKTAEEWGDLVRNAFPGYTGKRPKIQMWHGTNDEVLSFHNLGEAVKQWTNVLGADTVPSSVENDVFQSGWTRRHYKNSGGEVVIETIVEQDQPHNLQVMQQEALSFLGLDQLTDIRSGSMLKKDSHLNTTVVISAGRIAVTVRSSPGTASLSFFTLDGRNFLDVPEKYSSTGMFSFTISGNVLSLQASNLYIVRVTLNGAAAGTFKVPM
ncbi:MAG: PHB depolymerase family esterase [Fibrobacter sp.]|nr:PHB depolymerase family esterase [Fibrobacter sp.]